MRSLEFFLASLGTANFFKVFRNCESSGCRVFGLARNLSPQRQALPEARLNRELSLPQRNMMGFPVAVGF